MNKQIESLTKSYEEAKKAFEEYKRKVIKGYPVASGYMGWTGEKYMLFETEEAYEEYLKGD